MPKEVKQDGSRWVNDVSVGRCSLSVGGNPSPPDFPIDRARLALQPFWIVQVGIGQSIAHYKITAKLGQGRIAGAALSICLLAGCASNPDRLTEGLTREEFQLFYQRQYHDSLSPSRQQEFEYRWMEEDLRGR